MEYKKSFGYPEFFFFLITLWFCDKTKLAEAIRIITDYSACYSYSVYLKKKTPCCAYNDLEIPIGLTEAIEVYLEGLSASEYKELANTIAFEAGEFFRIRRTAIVKLLTRILADGFPNKEMLSRALFFQIKHREQLLRAL